MLKERPCGFAVFQCSHQHQRAIGQPVHAHVAPFDGGLEQTLGQAKLERLRPGHDKGLVEAALEPLTDLKP